MPRFRPDEIRQVRTHRLGTTAYVLLRDSNCFGLAPHDLRRVAGRRLVPVDDARLPTHPLPDSWVLVVPVCPGDSLEAVSRWAARLPRPDLHRVWFYERARVDVRRMYGPWREAGLPFPRRELVADVAEFNLLFANELNIRILLDHPLD